ncbi:hypothetical protein MSSAC_1310 [Methanosarcina siciliae C2J]|uniref:Uncharacterized protein n=1 Tax=Methanosarcina siciliae C2J TaxID=1434118 RepID=A0A0E3PLY0_9EURY|nr:hypothetical protein [Methanosarcina siciliae]AKB35900.1 hypothetical protein MSSAC_1310 [Methanosarcina siciliae C2J]
MRTVQRARVIDSDASDLVKLKADIINFKKSTRKYKYVHWFKSGTNKIEKFTQEYAKSRGLKLNTPQEFTNLVNVVYTVGLTQLSLSILFLPTSSVSRLI